MLCSVVTRWQANMGALCMQVCGCFFSWNNMVVNGACKYGHFFCDGIFSRQPLGLMLGDAGSQTQSLMYHLA